MKIKNILIPLLVFLILINGTLINVVQDSNTTPYTAFSSTTNDIVEPEGFKVAPYYGNVTSYSNNILMFYEDSSGYDLIGKGHANRVMQNCNIKYLTLHLNNVDKITDFRVKIWSRNETTKLYTLRASSGNMVASIYNGTFNLYFEPELQAKEGDYIGIFLKGKGNSAYPCIWVGNSSNKALSNIGIYHGTMPSSDAGWDTWENVSTYQGLLGADVYTLDPVGIIWIGDSIISGSPLNIAFTAQPDDTLNWATAPEKTIAHKFQEYYNISYQNLGIHGDSYPNLWNRFSKDVISKKPVFAVIEGGANNLGADQSASYIFDYVKLQIIECQQNGITPIVILCLPVRGFLNSTQNFEANKLNSMLIAYHSSINPNFALVDARSLLGKWDSNYGWSLYPEYAFDNIHLTDAGNAVLAEAVYNKLPAVCLIPRNGETITQELSQHLSLSLSNVSNCSSNVISNSNNSSNYSSNYSSNITFSWISTSQSPYRLQVASNLEFTEIISDGNFSNKEASIALTKGRYWWRVCAHSRDWSIANSFEII